MQTPSGPPPSPPLVHFSDLGREAPAVAQRIGERFAAAGIGLLGTLRADGSPRVSPIEVALVDGDLFVGMMPGSAKQRDAERDGRCSLLSAVADRHDLGGEGKLFGELRRVDAERAAALLVRMTDGLEVDPDDLAGSPVYEVVVSGAAWQQVEGDEFVSWSWTPADGLRHRRRVGASAQVVEADPAGGPASARPPAAAGAADG